MATDARRRSKEYGDFQTPEPLAREVALLVRSLGFAPRSLVEPTCGRGSLLLAGLDELPGIEVALGADINAEHLRHAREVARGRADSARIRWLEADFFAQDWPALLADLPEPLLLLGNLPWVTNAALGALRSGNLPEKANFSGERGLDAITGKANFDISEWMLLRLCEALRGRQGALAFLCKSAVARKVLLRIWQAKYAVARAALYPVDAATHFGAAVDACLLIVRFRPDETETAADVFADLSATAARRREIGWEDGVLLADRAAYRRWSSLAGGAGRAWRSGVKHDCAKVLEFACVNGELRNGFGELAEVEDEYIFPLLKSSHVARGRLDSDRWMLVPQRSPSSDTREIESRAPRTWRYLQSHANLLDARASAVYRGRPPFAVFGVGDYTFAPWKLAISGLYKELTFRAVGPRQGKPVVLDDTAYFLPCETAAQAELLLELLRSEPAQAFLQAFVFWDAKRPITAELLRRLDLRRLAIELGREHDYARLCGRSERSLFDGLECATSDS